MSKKITILTLYPEGITPGPRFRYEQYIPFLKNSFKVNLLPFYTYQQYQFVHNKPDPYIVFLSTILGYIKRYFGHIFICLFSDYIFIYRDSTPFGPPIYEWILAKIFRKKIILDYDDAIWMSDEKNVFKKLLRYPSKTKSLIKWSYKVSCGNDYLADFAKQYNSNVFVVPTTIDTEGLHNIQKKHKPESKVIGWTGSQSTLKYLDPIIPILKQLEKSIDFTFIVICNKDPKIKLKNYKFYYWNTLTEIEDLLKIDIGIMPLPDDKWSKGKCGFKALQYMALGIPAVVSPVGVNTHIVTEGVNGYLCTSDESWINAFLNLLNNHELRMQQGASGKKIINDYYSVNANKSKYLALFE